MQDLRVGDKFSIPVQAGLGIRHYGIYVGPRGPAGEDVVHNRKGAGVEFDYLARVCGVLPVRIERRAAPGTEELIVRRALSLLGKRYNLFEFNCEHFASVVQQGVNKSSQVSTGLGLALGAVGLLVAHSLVGRGEYDPVVDRYRDSKGRFAKR